MIATLERGTPIINSVEGGPQQSHLPKLATTSPDKLIEVARVLGIDPQEIQEVDLLINEIQSIDPYEVALEKAKAAYHQNGGSPVMIEDTSLELTGVSVFPPTYVKELTKTPEQRATWCEIVKSGKDKRAVAKVIFALFDGQTVQFRDGEAHGKISDSPRGRSGFGWDDMFEPDGQEQLETWTGSRRTFAEMTPAEKDLLSMRSIALLKLKKAPFKIGTKVYELPEPYKFQIEAVQPEKLSEERAYKHATNLEFVKGRNVDSAFRVESFPPYYLHELAGGAIKQYLPGRDSPSLGLLITEIDTASRLDGSPKRIVSDEHLNPTFLQPGVEFTRIAMASRASEFLRFHNPEMYEYLRGMMRGDAEFKTPERSNTASPVIERLIEMTRNSSEIENGEDDPKYSVSGTASVSELGYTRQFSEEYMSRKKSAKEGLILDTTGRPSSLFTLGGMPPVTGWKDVLTTAALSFMGSYIPRNSIFIDPEKRLRLFEAARRDIEMLDLPQDISALVLSQIGIAVGCDNPAKIGDFAKRAQVLGCASMRIYTTNTDRRVVETAEAIRQAVGDNFHLCVGPIVDFVQAEKLIAPNIGTNTLLAGHGGGENCTSLAGGGAANSLELLYLMSLDPQFNKTAIGLEGGTGSSIGALLPFIDVISLNKRGVQGGVETGGLYVLHENGVAVQPYHGSASPPTQWTEALLDTESAMTRLGADAILNNVEGKPGYLRSMKSVFSIVNNFSEQRRLAGTALADQQSRSIAELRRKTASNNTISNHRRVTPPAKGVADHHSQV